MALTTKLEESYNSSGVTSITNLSITRIRDSKYSLRSIDESAINNLISSIKYSGLLQPIMVRPCNGDFELVFGKHRLEACRRLGWKEVPVIIKKVNNEESFLLQIVENIQRNIKINPIEEGRGYKLLSSIGMTIPEIATKIGMSYQYVWSRLRMVDKLHPRIKSIFEKGKNRWLNTSHAEQLSMIKDKNRQLRLAKVIEENKISVSKLEKIIYSDIDIAEIKRKKDTFLSLLRKNDTNYYIKDDRICTVTESTINMIIDHLGRRAKAVGREAGRRRRKYYLSIAKKTIPKNIWIVDYFNEITGWGKISTKGIYIKVENPIIINPTFLLGYLEGLLSLKLIFKKAIPNSHYIFKIRQEVPAKLRAI